MCTSHDQLSNAKKWNWDGDIIIRDTVIPKTRKVIGTNVLYDVDIREFLTTADNAIVKRTIGEISENLSLQDRDLFFSHKTGSFDFKVRVLSEYISHEIAYVKGKRSFDAWQFPDETLTLKGGDCEDRAFLLASLILASGISNCNMRLAFGKIENLEDGKKYDHIWVMYKNESGVWQLIEPLVHCSSKIEKVKDEVKPLKKTEETPFAYIPYFLSNDEHLWVVYHPESKKTFLEYISSRSFWSGYNPSFGYGIHKGLINDSIAAQAFYNRLTDSMKGELFTLWKLRNLKPVDYLNSFATKVADVDITLSYNPLIHYDNAFIIESFNLMNQNLADKTSISSLAKALHSIADLYSHSSYPELAKTTGGKINLLVNPDPSSPNYTAQFTGNANPDYGNGLYDLKRFSVNSNLYKRTDKVPAIAFWNGKIISGRYGQSHDSHAVLERTQYWPASLKETEMHGALPHHNEIAVDDAAKNSEHVLYSDAAYPDKFALRREAASRHIALLFSKW